MPCNAIGLSGMNLTAHFLISKALHAHQHVLLLSSAGFWTAMQWFNTQRADPSFSLEYFMICFTTELISSHLETEPRRTLWHWLVSGA